jgi:23S rRNA (adenine2503-C2)-methyltransferase
MNLFDLDQAEFATLFASWNEPKFRADQLWNGLYKNLWSAPEDFSTLPKSLREKIEENFELIPIKTNIRLFSSDGETEKVLFDLVGGGSVETVLMNYDRRRTLCISTQVGCAMGCTFCATGQMGFGRNLSSGEIIAQILFFERGLAAQGDHVTNVVFMGMGEPFHNYDNVIKAIDTLNNAQGFNFGARRFTISTSGLVPRIRQFAEENRQVNLAISLHSTDDEQRSKMMPVNQKYPIDDLMKACRYYLMKTSRRITFEWALIYGVNDSEEEATKLAMLLRGMICHVNAIPLNPTTGYDGKATSNQRAVAFKNILEDHGIPCTIRLRRGIDIQAGCGQLASKNKTN